MLFYVSNYLTGQIKNCILEDDKGAGMLSCAGIAVAAVYPHLTDNDFVSNFLSKE
jgi:hypothetical protein